MGLFFIFFIISFLFFLCSLFIRRLTIGLIRKRLMIKYGANNFNLKYGIHTLSIDHISAHGPDSSICVNSFEVSFNFFGYLFNKSPFLNIKVGYISLSFALQNSDVEKKVLPNPLERWIAQRLFIFFTAIFVRSAQIIVENVSVVFLNINKRKVTFNLNHCEMIYKRSSHQILLMTDFHESSIENDEIGPILRIPEVKFDLSSNTQSFKYIIGGMMSEFKYEFDEINLDYSDGQTSVSSIRALIKARRDPSAEIICTIHQFFILFPIFDFNTKIISATINDLSFEQGEISSGPILTTRNGQNLLRSHSMKISKTKFDFQKLDITISTPFLIDLALFKRKFDVDVFNLFVSDRAINSPTTILRFSLSDAHILEFSLKKFSFKEKIITAKSFMLETMFSQSQKHKICECYRASFNYNDPVFAFKCSTGNVFLTNEFAQASFLQETFALIGFLRRQKSGEYEVKKKDISFDIKKLRIEMKTHPLIPKIHKSIEAKRIALLGLQLRQEKALQIIKARQKENINSFSNEDFENTSKKILFNLYKDSLGKIQMKNEEDLFVVQSDDFFTCFDGSAIKSRKEALWELKKSVKSEIKQPVYSNINQNQTKNEHNSNYYESNQNTEINNENKEEDFYFENEMGQFDYGAVKLNTSKTDIIVPRVGKLMSISNFTTSGTMFICKQKAFKKDDFYHFLINCDNKMISYLVPGVSNRTTTVFNIKTNISQLCFRYSHAFEEFQQDYKFGTLLFRRNKFSFRRLRFFDNMRLRYRLKLNMNVQKLEVDYNSKFYTFSPFSFLKIQLPNFSLICDDNETVSASAEELRVRIMNKLEFSSLLTLPNPKINFKMISQSPKNYRRPFFIPIQGHRMNEPTYDPYELYRTHTFAVHFDLSFDENKLASLNLDLIQPLIDCFFVHHPITKYFVIPVEFFHRASDAPTLSYLEFSATLTGLILTMNQNSLFAKIHGNPICIKFSNKEISRINGKTKGKVDLIVETTLLKVQAMIDERLLFETDLTNVLFDLSQSKFVNFKVANIRSEVSSCLMNFLFNPNLPFTFPFKDKETQLPLLIEQDQLQSNFRDRVIFVNIETAVTIFRLENNQLMQSNANSIRFEQRRSDDENAPPMNTVSFVSLNVMTSSKTGVPLITLQNPCYVSCCATNVMYRNLEAGMIMANPTEDDFAFFIPKIKKFVEEVVKNKKIKPPHITHFTGFLKEMKIRLIHEEKNVLASLLGKDFYIEIERSKERFETGKAIIKSLSAVNELVDDDYKFIIQTIREDERKPFFEVTYEKPPQITKCPFFKSILLNISVLTLRIDIPFIKKILSAFPSATMLKAFAFEDVEYFENENEFNENEPTSLELNETSPMKDSISGEISTSWNGHSSNKNGQYRYGKTFNNNSKDYIRKLLLCQNFLFNDFVIKISIRRKEDGVLKELKDRNMNVEKLEYLDFLGDREKMWNDVEQHIIGAYYKSVSKLFFYKKKKSQTKLEI
ncbi:hypothetical protein TRFO_09413 [Tritrichomonas foetus]|uniref:Uncharacterized protein n=1 Tax=Tritrichomonas foetus TaxID=1144522 RepID=A0A1J4JFI2_9EUKA|nr:hypothetical protein TRFO_09413 [Tritrichomonas foetus]|eukprot:OHS97425.1 hypothetical protein TRFO_09413 [Tritrichomonas foetus]